MRLIILIVNISNSKKTLLSQLSLKKTPKKIFEIKAKKEDYTIVEAQSIILLFQDFYLYRQIIDFLISLNSKLQLQFAFLGMSSTV